MAKVGIAEIVEPSTEIAEKKDPIFAALNLINEGIIIVDKSYHVKFRNDASKKIFSDKTETLCFKLYEKRKPCSYCPIKEKRVVKHDLLKRKVRLKNKYLEVVVCPVETADGEIEIIEIVRDITEEKLLEEKLRIAEEKYETLFESAGDGIFILDQRGRFVAANKKCEEMTGLKRDDYIGKSFRIVVSPKDYPKALKHYRDVLKGKSVRLELEIKHAKKGKIPVELTAVPLRKCGKIIGAIGIVRDVSERKKIERKLREYSLRLEKLVSSKSEKLKEIEQQYSFLMEQAGDGVVVIQDGLIVFVNKKVEQLTNYPKDHFIGMPFTRAIAPEYVKLVKDRYQQRMKGKNVPPIYEIELITKDGEKIPVEINATRIIFQGKPADLVILRDLRERKRMQQQLLEVERLATMGRLATMIAHDLRNPLTSIRNASYFLKMKLDKYSINGEMREMLDIINKEVDFASNTINNLLDFASPNKPNFKKVDVNQILEEVLFSMKIGENVKLVKKFARLPKIEADPYRLRRVFHNLITNATQAMPNGGKLTIETKKRKNFVEISIKDTGVGIPNNNLEKIFKPFFTTKAKGIGMGLAACKKLIEEHNGKIEVKSREGSGTVFTVKLPLFQHQQNGGENS